jgi:hypothetical protein
LKSAPLAAIQISLGSRVGVPLRTANKVVLFLSENQGGDYCDVCIAESCGIDSAEEVGHITSTLELFPDYLRTPGTCHRCGGNELPVIHAV